MLAGACLQLENPSVVNAAAARAHACHTRGSTGHCQSRCPADHHHSIHTSVPCESWHAITTAGTRDKHLPPALGTILRHQPSLTLGKLLPGPGQPHACPAAIPLAGSSFAFPGLQRDGENLTCSEVQESHPQACVPHQSVGVRHVPGYGLEGFGSSLGTRVVTERCSAGLLCYYGDEHWGDDSNKMQKNLQQRGSLGCHKLPSLPAPCPAPWPPTPCDTQFLHIFSQSVRLTTQSFTHNCGYAGPETPGSGGSVPAALPMAPQLPGEHLSGAVCQVRGLVQGVWAAGTVWWVTCVLHALWQCRFCSSRVSTGCKMHGGFAHRSGLSQASHTHRLFISLHELLGEG